jgi:hypothetical protein
VKLVLATAAVFILGYWIWPAPWQKAVLLLAFPMLLFAMGFFEKGELKRLSALFDKRGAKSLSHPQQHASTIQDEM